MEENIHWREKQHGGGDVNADQEQQQYQAAALASKRTSLLNVYWILTTKNADCQSFFAIGEEKLWLWEQYTTSILIFAFLLLFYFQSVWNFDDNFRWIVTNKSIYSKYMLKQGAFKRFLKLPQLNKYTQNDKAQINK